MKRVSNFISKNSLSRFDIDLKMMDLGLRFFYGVTAVGLYFPYLNHFVKNKRNFADAMWLWPVRWMDFVPESARAAIVLIFFSGGLFFCLCCAALPRKSFKILVFAFSFFALSLINSPSKINHNFHGMLFAAFFLIFINPKGGFKRDWEEGRIKLYYQAVQISLLGTYFLSGLWKLRRYTAALLKSGFEDTQCLNKAFAAKLIDANPASPFYLDVLNFFDGWRINNILWMGVILFQISGLAVSWFPPAQRLWGLLIVLFHFATDMFMNIDYSFNIYLALIFFVGHPYQRKRLSL